MNIKRKHGIICRQPNRIFGYFGWGSVAKLGDGTLICACSGNRISHLCPFGKTELFFSYDNARTWSSPVVVNDTWLDDRDAGIIDLGNGNVLLSWFGLPPDYLDFFDEKLKERLSEGELQIVNGYRMACVPDASFSYGSYVRLSRNGGHTWEKPVKVKVSAPHGPIMLKNKSLLYFGKEHDGLIDNQKTKKICAYRSMDMGKTWEYLGGPELPPNTEYAQFGWENFHEPHVVELDSGRILGMFRCQRVKIIPTGEIKKNSMFQSWSDDGGRTWSVPTFAETDESDPTELGVSGSPPHFLKHSSGAIICSYGRKQGDFSQRALISFDQGESWKYDIAIFEDSPNSDIGYPASVELADGAVLTVYYQQFVDEKGMDDKCSMLYTIWSIPGFIKK